MENIRRCGAFSLVELLTVVAMLGAMMAMVTPALLNSHQGSVLTTSGNTMADLAALARQNAASRHIITALIITSKTNSSVKQSVTVVEYEIAKKNWKRSHQWIRLAESVAAEDDGEADGGGVSAVTAIAPLQLDDGGVPLTTYSALVFYPDGRMASIGKPTRRLRMALARGTKVNTYDLVFNVDTSAFRILRP